MAGLLLIAVAALLAGRRDQLGIVRWGRQLSAQALASLGITRNRVPALSVWCELFQGLDIASLEAALGDWVRGKRSPGHIAINGKCLRGSATAQAPGVHLFDDRQTIRPKAGRRLRALRRAPSASHRCSYRSENRMTLPLAHPRITRLVSEISNAGIQAALITNG